MYDDYPTNHGLDDERLRQLAREAILEAAEPPATEPITEPPTPSAAAPANVDAEALAAAEAALAAKQQRSHVLVAGRALLEERYGDQIDVARMPDDEVLHYAGLTATEEVDTYTLPEQTETEAARAELARRWYQFADHQRRELAAEAGVDYDAIAAEKTANPNPNIWS